MALRKLGRYDIVRVLGKGAMGMVYEARDPNLDRRVAIKTIKVDALSQQASAEYEARFRTEARSAARLQHPHIVSVYDSGRHGDMAYLVMEFVQGDDLKQLLDRGITFSLAQATHMMCDLLSALDYAHRQNIVHRDVKPANLMIEANGRVKLTDFGVARIQDAGDATRTRGSMVGTLKYMAPEQVQGLAVDARADIFAAGVVLYQLLTGRRPFDGASDFAIIQQIVTAAPAAPSTINAQLPLAIDEVLAQALAPSREQRFASAQAFAVALEAAVATAVDQTIVPPPGMRPAVQWGATGANALGRQGRSGGGLEAVGDTSGSTVTQELELVYWKDVKDSDDLADLQGFLDRFPHGIYGDLARRRMKRLGGLERAEQTRTALQTRVMDGSGAPTGFVDTESMTEQTLSIESGTHGVASPAVNQDDQTVEMTVAMAVTPDVPVIGAESDQPAAAAAGTPWVPSSDNASDQVPLQHETADHHGATEARARPIKRVALLASLLVAAALVLWAFEPATDAQPAQPAQTVAPSGVPAADEGAAAVVTAAPTSEPVAAPVATSRLPTNPAPGRVAKPLAPVARGPVSPEQVCEGRVLLGYQSCMNDQCASAEFAGHAVCRQRRMAEQARDAQRNSRN